MQKKLKDSFASSDKKKYRSE